MNGAKESVDTKDGNNQNRFTIARYSCILGQEFG